MAKQEKKVKAEKAEPKAKPQKVVSTKRISDPNKVIDRSSYAIVESVLLKDFGKQKKGDTIKQHPNTMDMLRKAKIVK